MVSGDVTLCVILAFLYIIETEFNSSASRTLKPQVGSAKYFLTFMRSHFSWDQRKIATLSVGRKQ